MYLHPYAEDRNAGNILTRRRDGPEAQRAKLMPSGSTANYGRGRRRRSARCPGGGTGGNDAAADVACGLAAALPFMSCGGSAPSMKAIRTRFGALVRRRSGAGSAPPTTMAAARHSGHRSRRRRCYGCSREFVEFLLWP